MATTQELDDVTRYVRRMLPDQKQLTNMRRNEAAGFVQFDWHARHFVVMPTLNVYELKGESLLLTCSSMLMQAALQTKDRNFKIFTQLIDTIRSAEETLITNEKDGLAMVTSAKRILLKLSRKSASTMRKSEA